jgi:hypothetical protein
MDYAKLAATAKRLCDKAGRPITLYKLSAVNADAAKPWRGAAVSTSIEPVSTVGVFVVPQTSIPTESRGLAFDWIDQELLKRARHVCMVAADGLPDLDDYKQILDDGVKWDIIWGQCLRPGSTRLLYVFGLAQ